MFSDRCHPALCLLHLAAALAASAAFRHPCYLGVSFLGAFLYTVRLRGRKGALLGLGAAALGLAAGLFYASYHHFGVTPLFENFIGNRVTLESLLYGLTLGIRAAAVFLWLVFARRVLPTDKVVYLFGRVSPRLSLALSVIAGTVPKIAAQAGRIRTAALGIGRGPGQGGPIRRLRGAVGRFSALLGWAMESLIGASDAMRSRGGGFGRRTAYSLYRFSGHDRCLLVAMVFFLTVTGMAVLLGQTSARYDPRIVFNPVTPRSLVFLLGYGALLLLPAAVDTADELRFRRLRRKIPGSD